MFFGGLYGTLIGFRYVGKRPGESDAYDRMHATFGRRLRIFGPFVMLFGITLAASSLL